MWDFSSKGLPQGEIKTVNNKGKSTLNLPALSHWAGLHEQFNMQSKRLSDWRSAQKILCRCCWKVLAISINTSSVGLPRHQATHWLQQLAAPFLKNRGASDAKEAAVSREGKHLAKNPTCPIWTLKWCEPTIKSVQHNLEKKWSSVLQNQYIILVCLTCSSSIRYITIHWWTERQALLSECKTFFKKLFCSWHQHKMIFSRNCSP